MRHRRDPAAWVCSRAAPTVPSGTGPSMAPTGVHGRALPECSPLILRWFRNRPARSTFLSGAPTPRSGIAISRSPNPPPQLAGFALPYRVAVRRTKRLLVGLVAGAALWPLHVGAAWPTYHNDPTHAGYDSTAPASGVIASAWNAALDGSVYAEPLLAGNLVLVATENNTLYGLARNTRRAAWFTNLGTPVRS